MKLRAISLQCFRGWKSFHRVELNTPITLVVGQNGRGKSSLLNAIEWCLFGDQVKVAQSGIQERQNWEVVFYTTAADNEPTFVELEFEAEAEDEPIKIRRDDDQDIFAVTDSKTHVRTGEEAKLWLEGQGFPDWNTYKRAFCFHQEAARTRIVTARERSLLLAKLMGLDELIEARNSVMRYIRMTRYGLWDQPDTAAVRINQELVHRRTAAANRIEELEGELADVHINVNQINDQYLLDLKNAMKKHAEDLAHQLEIEIAVPPVQKSSEFMAWAITWPITAREDPPALGILPQLRNQEAPLEYQITALVTSEENLQPREREQQIEQRAHGDLDQRENTLNTSEVQRVEALDALKQHDSLLKILIDAKQIITQSEVDTQCPVCESSVPELLLSLDQKIRELEGPESIKLQDAVEQTTEAQRIARLNLEVLQVLIVRATQAKGAVEQEKNNLIEMLPEPQVGAADNVLALARKHLESLNSRIEGIAAIAGYRDQSINAHNEDKEHLKLIEEWLSEVRRADEDIDLAKLDEMKSFEQITRQISDLKSDLDFLSGVLLNIQREQSEVRSREVNAALGKYYSLILGVDAFVEIKVHQTPQQVSYKLVNRAGREAIRTLNQAAINALSLAAIFAQTEAGLFEGGWSDIVLDDPIQSLDEESQIGLSNAIEELSKNWSVLVATNPSDFSTRIRDYVDIPHQIYTLGNWDEEQGARVE